VVKQLLRDVKLGLFVANTAVIGIKHLFLSLISGFFADLPLGYWTPSPSRTGRINATST
jgi:hypothetical protein